MLATYCCLVVVSMLNIITNIYLTAHDYSATRVLYSFLNTLIFGFV